MPEPGAREDAFEALHQFAAVWHDKYAKPASAGENRKPPSLTMRANGVAAVLTEPQLSVVVGEYERMRGAEAEAVQLRERFAELSDGMAVAVELLDRLANDEECELWPRGCQTHGGYPAPCPHPLARQVVAAWRAVQAEGVSHV